MGGLIVTRLNGIPKDGEQLDMQVENVSLHVEKIEDHRIESVVVKLLPKEAGESEKKSRSHKEKQDPDLPVASRRQGPAFSISF